MPKDIKFKKLGKRPAAKPQAEDVPSAEGELAPDTRKVLIRAEDLRGVRGMRGEKGDVGRRGRKGLKGATGEVLKGHDGADGKPGAVGLTGRAGVDGVNGRQGTPGAKGDKGDKGDTGPVPRHKWEGTKLSFELPGGNFGRSVNLLGPAGGRGGAGNAVKETWQSIELQGQELVFVKNTAGPLGKETRVDLSSLGGGGGFAGLGPWRSRTEIVAPPGSGQVRFNNADPELATEVYVHEINNDGDDLASFLNLLDAGDVIYFQDSSDAANFIIVEISSNTDAGVYRTFGIANVNQQGAALSQNTVINLVATIAGGGAGSVVTALTIDVANVLTLTQTAGGDQTVDLSQFLTAAVSDALYLRLDTANDPLTGTLTTQDLEAGTNQTRDIGATGVTGRFAQVRGRLGNFLGSSNGGGIVAPFDASVTYGANPTGIVAGNTVQTGVGTALFRHGQGGGAANAFKPVATLGNVFSSGAGDASIVNNGGGSFLGGSAYASGGGNILLTTTSFGNFTWGYAYSTGNNAHTFRNGAAGGFLGGYSQGSAAVTVENFSQGPGCFTWVRPTGGNALSTINVFNRGDGGFLQGFPQGLNGATTTLMEITTAAIGGFCQGTVGGGNTLQVAGPGGFAQGDARGGDLIASGQGSFAHGSARGSNAVTASGTGSFAVGDSNAGAITASALNASQFGPGTNALADSLQVGTAGIRFKGTAGAPGAPQNGDFWVAGGYVYVRSNGVSIQIAGPGPLTN
jgi:hypothetical protein